MMFVFHKMPLADCECCWERPRWDYAPRRFIFQFGRYLVGFKRSDL